MRNTLIPYFLTNERWYKRKKEGLGYELTPEAPPEAIESYNDFYNKKEVIIDGFEYEETD